MRTRSILSSLGAVGILAAGGIIALRGPSHASPAEGLPISQEALFATAKAVVEAGPAAEGLPSKDRVQKLIVDRLKETSARVKELPFSAETPAGRWELVNVIASFRPEAKHRVMVGAHWDTRLWADEDPDPKRRDQPITGANDGASGVAVLLELAKVLDRDPPPPGVGVDLVFFDGEEGWKSDPQAWFYGSKELAERWFTTGVTPPKAGVIVDMVAKKGLQIRREEISQKQAGAVLDRIFAIAKEKGHGSFVDAPGIGVLDDHIPFLQRGIPVVDLIDLSYPQWHTHEDTLDKIDPRGMAEVADVVLGWIRSQKP